MQNLTGHTLGRYHILEELGKGGMAIVYKAFDTRLDRNVAVKIIRVDQFAPAVLESILKRFDGEAKVVASLIHPNIVGVIDYGEYEGSPYMVMPYLPGGTLKERLGKTVPWQDAAKLLLPIAEALGYAHDKNIIHRDVKPSNILLTQGGQPMLTDFGIAKILESEETHTLTGTGMGIGTPEYMAPEQWNGQAGPQSDIYSLGVVFYELVTGQKPYNADTPAAIMLKQANDPLPRPRQFVPGLPEAVEKVLFKALAKRLEDRYQNMSEFADALERLTREQTTENWGSLESKKEEETLFAGGGRKPGIVETHKVPIQEEGHQRSVKWWPWAAGLGGLLILIVACVVFAALVLPGFLPKPYPASTNTPAPIPTFTPNLPPGNTPSATITFPPVVTSTPEVGIGSTWMRPADAMMMIIVPEGAFSMGGTVKQAMDKCKIFFGNLCKDSDYLDEQPAHSVSLDAFWIDRTEVTNAMYEKCVNTGSCLVPTLNSSKTRSRYYGNSQYADYPVIYVDWAQASTYCEWAGGRLPTEAEWEKAARGDDERAYPWGDSSPTCTLANFGDPKNCVGDTSPVASNGSAVSPYGVLDMAGNVSEWINDWYSPTYYSQSSQNNPTGPEAGQERVLRGGSWYLNTNFIRSSNRDHNPPSYKNDHIGFRCARSATP
jgi:eukaryotic-like serine/threonine-protein kinase